MSYDDYNVPSEQQIMIENQWSPEDEQTYQLQQQGGNGFMPEDVLTTNNGIVYDGNNPYGYVNDGGMLQPYFNADGSPAVTTNDYEPEKPSLWGSFMDGLKSLFGSAPDANGRQQQSLAASIVLGAANNVMKSMSENKQIKAMGDLADRHSQNRINERTQEEKRLRDAASAMPSYTPRPGRAGLLARART